MIKFIYTLMLVLISFTTAQGQRMLPKQKGLEINFGTLSDESPGKNYYLNLGMTLNGKNGNYQLWALEYTHRYYSYKSWHIPIETFTGEAGYSFFLLGDHRKNISLNAALSVVAGYQSINRSEHLLDDGARILNKDGMIYGIAGRLSLETYLSDQWILVLQGRIKMLWGEAPEEFLPLAGVGLRINL